MPHQRQRVIFSKFHTGCGQLQRRCLPRAVQRFALQAGELRQVFADELAFRVKLQALADRVEDAKVRLRVAAAARRPLPTAVVG